MPEHFVCTLVQKALYKYSSFPFLSVPAIPEDPSLSGSVTSDDLTSLSQRYVQADGPSCQAVSVLFDDWQDGTPTRRMSLLRLLRQG